MYKIRKALSALVESWCTWPRQISNIRFKGVKGRKRVKGLASVSCDETGSGKISTSRSARTRYVRR